MIYRVTDGKGVIIGHLDLAALIPKGTPEIGDSIRIDVRESTRDEVIADVYLVMISETVMRFDRVEIRTLPYLRGLTGFTPIDQQ